MIVKKLHHSAYRCQNSEETRAFYEDFRGLRFAEPSDMQPMIEKARALGIETRGPVNHGAITSVYFRDPNGYEHGGRAQARARQARGVECPLKRTRRLTIDCRISGRWAMIR